MVGLFLYIGEKPSTYGLPLSVTFVRPDQAAAPGAMLSRRHLFGKMVCFD